MSLSLPADRGSHLGDRGHRDDDVRGRLPQPLSHRHHVGGDLSLHVSTLQGTAEGAHGAAMWADGRPSDSAAF